MTPEVIAELRALEAAATPGPWFYDEFAHEQTPYSKRRVYRVEIKGDPRCRDCSPWREGLKRWSSRLVAQIVDFCDWNDHPSNRDLIIALRNNADALLSAAEEAQQAEFKIRFTQQWYAERWKVMHEWFRSSEMKDTESAHKWFCIVANGTETIQSPPTYAQLLNMQRHRADAAAEESEKLRTENADLQQKLKFLQNELDCTRKTRNQFESRLRQLQAEKSEGPVVEVTEHTRGTSPGCSQDSNGSMEKGQEEL